MPATELTVVVVSEDPLVRSSLTAALRAEGLDALLPVHPDDQGEEDADAILWDLGLRPLPRVQRPLVALTEDEERARTALARGALGVLSRGRDPEAMSAAIWAAAQGLRVVDPWLVAAPDPPEPLAESLTARERQVLQLVAEGLSNRVIGLRLDVSEHTAKFHVNALMQKLTASTRTEAVVEGIRRGLLVV